MKKTKKQNIALGLTAILIIGILLAYSYFQEQAGIKGFNFGKELQQIQQQVKKLQNEFESKVNQWKEGDLTKEEFLEYSHTHLEQFEELSAEYDDLTAPESFVSAVKLFKLSTEVQLESDKEYIKWIETGDESFKIRSDSLFQESFEFEIEALSQYKVAQQGLEP